jgi:hypothetical protein
MIVDNATTQTAKAYSLFDFGKSIGIKCITDTIEYIDAQDQQKIKGCYFKTGSNKGLIEISKEFNVKLPPKLKFQQLRHILSNHPAFKIVNSVEYALCFLIILSFRHRVLNNLLINIT